MLMRPHVGTPWTRLKNQRVKNTGDCVKNKSNATMLLLMVPVTTTERIKNTSSGDTM
jgi:hypothetical protein